MSIELDNPKTAFEKVDAAANFVAQLRLALMCKDHGRAAHVLERTERLLFEALAEMEAESANADVSDPRRA